MFQSGVAPVYVSRARAEGARLIELDQAGDVIVLDDGFQHRALARDVDIVAVYAGSDESISSFCRGELLPLGRFRERRNAALSRADIVVISERRISRTGMQDSIDSRLLAVLPTNTKVYRAILEAEAVQFIEDRDVLMPSAVVAFAGIANPEAFFTSLETLGFVVEQRFAFPDHHHFSQSDLEKMVSAANGLPLVCTQKDAVKVQRLAAHLRSRVAALNVRTKVLPADAFAVQIARMIQAQG
jgi:tetraacyldisaccharide 4'-kinase